MAIEAALREDDFETAYSYTVSRLTPSGADVQPPLPLSSSAPKLGHAKRPSRNANAHKIDDISWRAAFLAGRFRPSSSTSTANLTPAQSLRRLEQRTDLLALALLAPNSPALAQDAGTDAAATVPMVAASWFAGWHASPDVKPTYGVADIPWSKYTEVIYAFACVCPPHLSVNGS